jgi:phenylacetate-CoA ligase
MVLTTAENLQDYQRYIIEEVLGPVYDLYGCSEINGIANECNYCGKYHIIDTHIKLEYGNIVDEFCNQELIITDLDNFAFPMIRYQNGDIGKRPLSNGKCKINFSCMESVCGRQSDIIVLPGGGTLSVPSFFGSMLLKKVNGICKYQIEKDKHNHLIIKLVVNSSFTSNDKNILANSINSYIGNKIQWEICIVNDIPNSSTGKFKLVVDKTK